MRMGRRAMAAGFSADHGFANQNFCTTQAGIVGGAVLRAACVDILLTFH